MVQALAAASTPLVSAGTYLEMAIVVDANHDPVLSARLDELLAAVNVQIEPVTDEHAQLAREAYQDLGKGSGHAAALNFEDCFAYALDRATRRPLPFKGTNFAQTDIRPVSPPAPDSRSS